MARNWFFARRTLSLALLAVCSASVAFASGADSPTEALQRGRLSEAVEIARERASRLATADDWQVLGTLLLVEGRPYEAEQSLMKAQEIGAGMAMRPSGLEEFEAPGGILGTHLARLKQSVALGLGRAALMNNLGVARLMLGRGREAMEDFDQAAVMADGWTVPWINGALAATDEGRWDLAERNAKFAADSGDRSVRLLAVRAEIALAQESHDSARDFLRQAERIDPEFPYALLVRARLLRQQGQARDAERALVQALTNGPIVATESSFVPAAGRGYGLGGGFGETHLRLFHHGMSRDLESYRFLYQTNRARIEGRDAAYQRRDLFEGVYAGSLGTLYLLHRDAGGGRPGAETPIVGLTPQDQATYSFRGTTAIYLNRWSLGDTGSVLFLGKHRQGILRSRLSPMESYQTTIDDRESHLELRLDTDLRSDRLTFGGAWSTLQRGGAGARTFDPAEVIMPRGRTDVWTAYGVFTRPFGPLLSASAGAVLANTSGGSVVQPILEMQYGRGPRPIRLGITPRLNDTVMNLLPMAYLAESPQRNDLDRHAHVPQDFNNDPLLLGRDSRILDYEIVLGAVETEEFSTETSLFHSRIFNARLQGADPRSSTTLLVTPIARAETSGVAQRMRYRVQRDLALRGMLSYQLPRGRSDLSTYDIESWPDRIPVAQTRLPNFPNWQAGLDLDWTPSLWNVSLALRYVGERTRAVSVTDGDGSTNTYVGEVPAALGAHLFMRRRLNDNGQLVFALYNLTRVAFYEGYPGRTTGIFGFEYRF
jgi:tetratricopeptide (TPR) repeat protein